MIEPGSVVGDMIHEVDLFTTFARLAGATGSIPTDRIVDGIDNARQATRELSEPPVDLDTLPFDPLEYINFELPWDGLDAD